MGVPVVTVAAGGLPIVEAAFGTPVTEAANGRGTPVTKVVGKPGLPVRFETIGVGGGTFPGGAEAQAFLARTSGLDATHMNAYAALIDSLVADGVWAKLDALYIFATQNATTSKLNLVSANYTANDYSAPTFTVDRGWNSVNGDGFKGIDSNFNPSIAVSPKYTNNSAHLSVWNVTGEASSNGSCGSQDMSDNSAYIIAKFGGGATYFRINTVNAGGGSYSAPNTTGHFLGSRTGSATTNGYRNGALVGSTDTTPATGVSGSRVFACGCGRNTHPAGFIGVSNQQAMLSIGAGLTGTEATNFYNRLRTYMTTVGVP